MRSQLLSKVERLHYETGKTSRLGIVAKFGTHFTGSFIKLNPIGENSMHGSLAKSFTKS